MMSIKTDHFTWNFAKNIDGEITAWIQISEKLYRLNTKRDLKLVKNVLAGKALEAFEFEFRILQESISKQS